ncbi:uncharacterized protein LOC108086647 [Drosophila ficusphila]|uniref:uncharacterized protein LOC108086647 n=1 Tax=Drosophila ficusphila TaxID=30025 RepID=UPI0007E825D5|nr:uncharacterized protein LOC108086647 [Drosophila ficusphila]
MASGTELLLLGLSSLCALLLLAGLASGEGVQCYECNHAESSCNSMEEATASVRECPLSTMCSLTVMKHEYRGEVWTTKRRGCAVQAEEYQEYFQKDWVKKHRIKEFPEGCIDVDRTTHCLCSGSLCNSSKSYSSPGFRLTIVLLISSALAYRKILLPV